MEKIKSLWTKRSKWIVIAGILLILAILMTIITATKTETHQYKYSIDRGRELWDGEDINQVEETSSSGSLAIPDITDLFGYNKLRGIDNDNVTAYVKEYMQAQAMPEEMASTEDAAPQVTADNSGSTSSLKDIMDMGGDYVHWTHDITVETTEFDALENSLTKCIKDLGGYVESANVDTGTTYSASEKKKYTVRRGQYTIRIPEKNVPQVEEVIKAGNVIISNEISATDLTKPYNEASAEMDSLNKEKKKLEDLIQNATDIQDILAINDRISTIDANIDYYNKQVSSIKKDTDYSTYNLTINEVAYFTDTIQAYRHEIGRRWAKIIGSWLEDIIPIVLTMLVTIMPFLFVIYWTATSINRKNTEFRINKEYEVYSRSRHEKELRNREKAKLFKDDIQS